MTTAAAMTCETINATLLAVSESISSGGTSDTTVSAIVVNANVAVDATTPATAPTRQRRRGGASVRVQCDAPTARHTDWRQCLALYDQLLAQTPTPVVALNRAVALAEVQGPAAALAAIEHLDLDSHHLYHATRSWL